MDESLPSAGYDPLTGLATRNLLQDRLHQALRFAERDLLQVAVMIIDLNRFRAIVEGISRSVGDEVLKTVAARIVGCVRNTDKAARIEADEFALMLAGAEENPENAFHVARRIGDAISQPMVVEGRTLSVTCAIGVALYPGEGQNAEVLFGNAATAMRLAKQRGLNVCDFYGSGVNALAEKRESAALRRAVEQHELVLHYQPKVDLRTGQVIQLEALVRWEKPEQGTSSRTNSSRSPKRLD
jgi:diguanylate cyclase (GGDEF)-like protein